MLSLDEASIEGFAPGTAGMAPIDALGAVRRVLDGDAPLTISEEKLNSYKALLKQQMSARRESPEYWIDAIGMRYLDSRDFTTGCDAKIDAVTSDKIMEILSSLGNGLRVEYIITEK